MCRKGQRVRVVKEAVLKTVCQKWLVGSNPTVGGGCMNGAPIPFAYFPDAEVTKIRSPAVV